MQLAPYPEVEKGWFAVYLKCMISSAHKGEGNQHYDQVITSSDLDRCWER